jgi:hypothetical protein
MGDQGEEPLGLDSVQPPNPIPSSVPDRETQLEENEFRREQKLTKSAALHRTVISERERTLLTDECLELRFERTSLHRQLHELEPRYASLRRAYSGLKSSVGGSTLLMFVGSVMVSIAGALDQGTLKYILLSVGITASACGILWGGWSLYASGNADYASETGIAHPTDRSHSLSTKPSI